MWKPQMQTLYLGGKARPIPLPVGFSRGEEETRLCEKKGPCLGQGAGGKLQEVSGLDGRGEENQYPNI